MALAAFLGSLCGLALNVPILVATSWPKLRLTGLGGASLAFLLGVVVLGVAAILGLISIVKIELSGGRITGRNLAVGAVLIAVFGLAILPVWSPVMPGMRSVARRLVCGGNLQTIGWGMLVYSFDYEDGQNVLFTDIHVRFERIPFCGVEDDNVYTFWDGEDVRRGAAPVLGSQPQDRKDSLLVHDPPVRR